jgi:hypothetical protein
MTSKRCALAVPQGLSCARKRAPPTEARGGPNCDLASRRLRASTVGFAFSHDPDHEGIVNLATARLQPPETFRPDRTD